MEPQMSVDESVICYTLDQKKVVANVLRPRLRRFVCRLLTTFVAALRLLVGRAGAFNTRRLLLRIPLPLIIFSAFARAASEIFLPDAFARSLKLSLNFLPSDKSFAISIPVSMAVRPR